MSRSKRIAVILLLFGVLVTFYSVTYSSRNITDTDLNSLQTRALALHGDIDLSRYRLDPRALWVSWHGHRYSIYGVGVSLPAVPLYEGLARLDLSDRALQAAASIPFVAAAVLVMFMLLLKRFSPAVSTAGAVVFGFGTTIWPVAAMAFYQNAITALFQTIGIAGFLSESRRAPILAGVGFAAATFVRPLAGVALAVAGIFYLVRGWRETWRYALGAALPLLGVVIQNRWLWGGWLTGGYSHNIAGFRGDAPHALWGLLFGWWRGLFIYSPALLLGFIGIAMAIRKRKDAFEARLIVLGAIAVATILLYAKFTTWYGGLNQFGYRYLLDAVPFLIVLGAYGLTRSDRLRPWALLLGALSILTTTLGAARNAYGFDYNLFATKLTDTSLGQAWLVGVQHPLSSLLRLLGVAAIACGMFASAMILHRRSADP